MVQAPSEIDGKRIMKQFKALEKSLRKAGIETELEDDNLFLSANGLPSVAVTVYPDDGLFMIYGVHPLEGMTDKAAAEKLMEDLHELSMLTYKLASTEDAGYVFEFEMYLNTPTDSALFEVVQTVHQSFVMDAFGLDNVAIGADGDKDRMREILEQIAKELD